MLYSTFARDLCPPQHNVRIALTVMYFVLERTAPTIFPCSQSEICYFSKDHLACSVMHSFLKFQNLRIDVRLPKEYFKVLKSSLNGSYHYVQAIKEGQTIMVATLTSIVDQVCLLKVNVSSADYTVSHD